MTSLMELDTSTALGKRTGQQPDEPAKSPRRQEVRTTGHAPTAQTATHINAGCKASRPRRKAPVANEKTSL